MSRKLKFNDIETCGIPTEFEFAIEDNEIRCYVEREVGYISKQNAIRLRDFLNEFLDNEGTQND